ncbi:MAG: PIN domain-containing protein [Rubrobacter sp.]|jgi:predicted nucleic acid-binding protein|nr:PIN domain-containing protein [Rubrobacter sp.]
MSDEIPDGAPAFVDSNVLIYAHDEGAGIKREAARALLERLWEEHSGRLSVQVLQEFFVNATISSGRRKLEHPLDAQEAREVVEDFSKWGVHRPGAADVLAAIDIHRRVGISFRDAMVVQSASSQGCEVLFSEDLNDGQIYEGVRLKNPFAT